VTLARLTFWLGLIALLLAGLAWFAGHHLVNAGPGMTGACRVLPALLLGGALAFFCAAGVSRLLTRFNDNSCRTAWATVSRVSMQVPRGLRQWFMIILGCLLVVLVFDLSGFLHGFFRLDDFEYLRVVRQENIFRQLLLPHGGHSLPFFRVEMLALATVSGPTPPLFNFVNLTTCVALLATGCWLLVEMGVGWLGLAAFVGLNWFWPGWGDFTAGYFSLLDYVQGYALGFAAIAALLRTATTGRRLWLAMAFVLATAALGVGLVSTWVLPAMLTFAAANWSARGGATVLLRPFVIGFAMVTVAFTVCNLLIFRHGEFLGPDMGGPSHPAGMLWSLLSGVGGVMLYTLLPVQAGSLNTGGLVHVLEIGAIGLGLWPVLRLWPRLDRTNRRLLLAAVVTLLVQIAMIVIARRPLLAGFYWSAKWTAMAHCTFVIIVALVVDRCVRLAPRGGEPVVKWAAAFFLVGLWAAVATPHLLDAMGAPVSRANNVRNAISRRTDFDRLSASIERLAFLSKQRPVTLPPCSPDCFDRVFPRLEGYSLAQVASVLPADLIRIAPQSGPPAAPLRALIANIPDLRRLYPDAVP
jgi:hypothetical protein